MIKPTCIDCCSYLDIEYDEKGNALKVECPKCGLKYERGEPCRT